MNQIINNFLKSLNQIEEIDFSTQRVTLIDDQINIHNDTFSTYENNFVTKLNEKYAILNHIKEIIEPIELVRQLQIPKKYAYSDIADQNVEASVNKIQQILGEEIDPIKELYLIPDFIIHKNEEDKNPENQRLIAEVKTENNLSFKKFAWDFFKLIIYVNKFNFQNGVFLSINMHESLIYSYIKRYFEERLYLPYDYSKLYIIIKENYQSETKVISLQQYFDRFIVSSTR